MSKPDVTEPEVEQQDTERTFDRLLDEGTQRLGRSWSGLLSTGLLGGMDIGVGVLALLLVEHQTGNLLLGALAFSIGFIALTLARSELFTEDFLVPVAAVVAKAGHPRSLVRLWMVTIMTNLVGGWLISWLIIAGFPELRGQAIESAQFYIDLGIGWRAFALAMLGGFLITLMTHMQHATEHDGVKLVPATVMGFLLAAGRLNHAVVASLTCFAALHAGAPVRVPRLAGAAGLRRPGQHRRWAGPGHRAAAAAGPAQGGRRAQRRPRLPPPGLAGPTGPRTVRSGPRRCAGRPAPAVRADGVLATVLGDLRDAPQPP